MTYHHGWGLQHRTSRPLYEASHDTVMETSIEASSNRAFIPYRSSRTCVQEIDVSRRLPGEVVKDEVWQPIVPMI